MLDNNVIGNLTTIGSYIVGFVFPYFAVFGFTHEQVTSLVLGLLVLGYMIFNSYKPNTFKFLNNHNLFTANSEAQTEEDIIESNDYEAEC